MDGVKQKVNEVAKLGRELGTSTLTMSHLTNEANVDLLLTNTYTHTYSITFIVKEYILLNLAHSILPKFLYRSRYMQETP